MNSRLEYLKLSQKRIFLRADLNVPIEDGKIISDLKLKALLPTIKYIHEHGGKIILATHIGRPKLPDESLSTKILIPWFNEVGLKVNQEDNLARAKEKSNKNFETILLLENLRFYPGEQSQNPAFAKELFELADVYVNDAFGSLHRTDTSISLLPKHFENKTVGLLIEKETEILDKLKTEPKQPFMLILGGNKVKEKIEIIQGFLDKPENARPKTILIGGAIAYTFLKAQTISTGESIIEESVINIAKNILSKAQELKVKILLPKDHLLEGEKVIMVPNEQFPTTGVGVDIGQSTIDIFIKKIQEAKTIFLNGTMGVYTNPAYESGTKIILKTIAKTHAYSIVGGGDATGAVYKFNLESKFKHLSTGGGATLKYLSLPTGKENNLPGLKSINEGELNESNM